jgi:hypothetical protein
MRTAYLILAHKNPGQVERLIRALLNDDAFFFLHLDANSSAEGFTALESLGKVFFVGRKAVSWGGWNLVAATLELMAAARTFNCERYHLLSGQDYPLKSKSYLETFFADDRLYLNYFPLPATCWSDGGMARFQQFHFVDQLANARPVVRHVAQRLCRFIRSVRPREMPYGLLPYGGSQWWSITGEAVDYIIAYINSHPGILPFFEKTLIPDEFFFQTVIINSHLCGKVVNDNQRYMVWGATRPAIITSDRITEVLDADKCFARKFDADLDATVFPALDRHREQE